MGYPAERSLLVVQPDADGILDNFERWLTDEGVRIRTIRPYDGDAVPTNLVDDAVIVLGGAMSSVDDGEFPWLEDIRELFRSAHRADRAALGICLGAQLLAQAHGGRVRVGRHGTEGGLIEVRWLAAADGDALVGGLPNPFPVGALHGDSIDVLPPSATWLAASGRYPHQVFRVGSRSWGVQFHPEVSVPTMRMWLSGIGDDPRADVRALTRSVDEFDRHQTSVVAGTSLLARRFAQLISPSAQTARPPQRV